MTVQRFRKIVHDYYREHGRSELPWRKTHDPYKILVSEIMLQQTQVERVIPYYKSFIKKYPTVQVLAKAPLGDVLTLWQGLGYNRRAKFLHGASTYIVENFKGKIPIDSGELESIWGIGPYTARAVMTFAHNHDAVFIETNIRTAVIHHFFTNDETVSDEQIAAVLKKVLPRGEARAWYSALMDYGTYLKRSGIRTNTKIKGYKKQSTFKGSRRELRGALLRALSNKTQTQKRLLSLLPERSVDEVQSVLDTLIAEGMVTKKGGRYSLPT